jgi:anti-sigma-K factor RskA
MNHDELDTLAAIYAVGALDGDDLPRFRAHLAAGCERCAGMLRDAGDVLARAALGRAQTPAVPPPPVKAELLRRIDHGRRPAHPSARSEWLRWAAVSAVAVVAGAGLTGMYVATRYEARIGQMVRETITQRERLYELLRDPATRAIDLRGLDPVQASGRVVWNEAKGGLLFVSGLPPAPAGKAYELWTITGGTPRPAGLFHVDDRGRATHRVDATDRTVDVFAVTLEPEAGVPAPTGPIVLASR